MNLYHYFDKSIGPFVNLSDNTIEEAKQVLDYIRINKPDVQCAKRQDTYIEDRLYYESIIRDLFIKKGGRVEKHSPHYMVVEHSPWLSTWYENSAYIKIPIEEFDIATLSFTYGDSHPTFSPRVNDGKEYRKKLYNYEEILEIIDKYGLPQDWNDDGKYGPERYVEVHIWSDEVISAYKKKWTDI
ncbi:MAG: hypothetical protein EWM47_06380 [Anaerolineaceae bacterium]|nr:MAG: hypothetical protein EWM47_06380 [Anaerolineaceae bacterium]